MTPIVWKNERRKVADLIPFEGNPRMATEKDVADLTTSLDKFGLADPIIINVDNRVIGGHFRLRIEKSRKTEEVDVRVPSRALTDEEHMELLIRLNKNTGRWDPDLLAHIEIATLQDVGFSLPELNSFGLTPPDQPLPGKPQPAEIRIKFKSPDNLAAARDELKALAERYEAKITVTGAL